MNDTIQDEAEESAEMSESDFESFLLEVLETSSGTFYTEAGEEIEVERVSTFSDQGMMTRNHGLVVRMGDSQVAFEFQLTIVQSR